MNTTASAFDAQGPSLTASTVVQFPGGTAFNPHVVLPPRLLPDAFWTSRKYLTGIRDFARFRRCSPDALFGALLARAGATWPHPIRIDTGIGKLTPTTLFVGLVGNSGAGKTTANDLAREVNPGPADFTEKPLGTGQGIVQAFVRWDKAEGRNVQHCHSALFVADEGKTFAIQSASPHSILAETVRSAFSGAPIGQTNATAHCTRSVEDYDCGLLINLVPEAARTILAQADVGTPQRFLWFNTCDPDAPDKVKAAGKPNFTKLHLDPIDVPPVQFDAAVKTKVEAIRLSGLRGQSTLSDIDRHMPLVVCRVAAMLALWDGRMQVQEDDWRLAEMVWQTSCAVRDQLVAELREADEAVEAAKMTQRISTQITLKNADQKVAKYARDLADKVKAAGRISNSDLRKKMWAPTRPFFEPAMAHAEAKGWVVRDGQSGWRMGV